MDEKQTPFLSICCLTFNHANYIRQAFDSFLMQKTNFKFEVIVHDDASTDGTTAIIEEYAHRYPEIFKPIIQPVNLYSQGIRAFTARFMFPKSNGKYIAICDGDDYWTDPNKLQKQIDFLEEHLDYIFCYHKTSAVLNGEEVEISPKGKTGIKTLKDFLFRQNNPTLSMVFRRDAVKDYLETLKSADFATGDFALTIILAQQGISYFMPDIMAVYRLHDGGVFSKLSTEKKLNIGIRNRKAILKNIKLGFSDRLYCLTMIWLRKLKLLLLKSNLMNS